MSKRYDDALLVAEYEKCKRCRVVAEKFGCSDETVRRALIKFSVPRVKRHPRPVTPKKASESELKEIVSEYYNTDLTINDLAAKHHRSQKIISKAINTYGCGIKYNSINGKKITDEQLREEAKTSTCSEIAKRHNMSPERVYRRARRLGIEINSRGEGGHWFRRAVFHGSENEFDDSITLKKVCEKYHGVCQICGRKVNWNDIKDGHVRRDYPSVDHIVPLSRGGTHTWGNVQLAHMSCNAGKCDKTEYAVEMEAIL